MDQESTPSHGQPSSKSVFANILTLSGYLGLAAGLCLEFYRLYLLDSVLGIGRTPPGLETSRFALLAGSVAILMYARIFDDVFHKWVDLAVLCLLIGQWGVPIWTYIDMTVGGPGSPFGFFTVVSAGIFAIVGVLIAINYTRRCWPAVFRQ